MRLWHLQQRDQTVSLLPNSNHDMPEDATLATPDVQMFNQALATASSSLVHIAVASIKLRDPLFDGHSEFHVFRAPPHKHFKATQARKKTVRTLRREHECTWRARIRRTWRARSAR